MLLTLAISKVSYQVPSKYFNKVQFLTYLFDSLAEVYAPNLGFGYASLAAIL